MRRYPRYRILYQNVRPPVDCEPLDNCPHCNQLKLRLCDSCSSREMVYRGFASSWVLLAGPNYNDIIPENAVFTSKELAEEYDWWKFKLGQDIRHVVDIDSYVRFLAYLLDIVKGSHSIEMSYR